MLPHRRKVPQSSATVPRLIRKARRRRAHRQSRASARAGMASREGSEATSRAELAARRICKRPEREAERSSQHERRMRRTDEIARQVIGETGRQRLNRGGQSAGAPRVETGLVLKGNPRQVVLSRHICGSRPRISLTCDRPRILQSTQVL